MVTAKGKPNFTEGPIFTRLLLFTLPIIATSLLQVLYNLINNGINYAGEDKTVIVKQTCTGDKVRVAVIDHGVGIAPDQIPLIWDRYYKVDRVHKRAVVGTGLGLSIVKTVLERHAAQYGVESTEGEGSTFWFEIPIEKE